MSISSTEMTVKGHSRSLKTTQFDRLHTSFQRCVILTMTRN